MIQVEKLSYGFPEKELYRNISFSIEQGQHCALIGSNGCGKSTLVEMLTNPEKYWFDGKITKDEECRTGYAGQFCVREKMQDCTVFEYLSRRFTELQEEIAKVCEEMAHPENDEEDMEWLFSQYQALLDRNEAMDGDNYENVIRRQLNAAGMGALENTSLSAISGGEYKLLQIMKEMLLAPNFLVLDEPDVFLDFENLNGLRRLINGFKGTILAVTHNRYLLNHCFNKILHLENGDLQECIDHTLLLAGNPKVCEQLAQNAYATITKIWNAGKAAENFLKLCENLLTEQETVVCGEEFPSDGPGSPAPVIPQGKMYRTMTENVYEK